MLRGLRRFLILLAVFVAAVIGFSLFLNREPVDMTTDMSDATLPVVYFQKDDDTLVNEIHGYVTEMDADSVRDTITPMGEDGELSVRVDAYGLKIETVEYEIRSLDTTRLVTNGTLTARQSNDIVRFDMSVPDMLTVNEEYMLTMKLDCNGKDVYYYTRIIEEEDSDIDECLSFVEDFHGVTMDKDRMDEIADYMEPAADGDNTNLQKVTINSYLTQACWGDLEVSEVTEPVLNITELNTSYNVILMDYIASSTDEETGQTDYYNVEEYYRVRFGTDRVFLLSFERSTEQIFRGADQLEEDAIDLGIRSESVDYSANDSGNIVCFEQEGELWNYNMNENKLTRVFSFRSEDDTMDIRENYDQHDIRIIQADESGSVDFVVYGYMNRGSHEGQVGISINHYDSAKNTVEEQLFLPINVSYQMMKEELGQVMYITEDDRFFFNLGEKVYEVDMNTMEQTTYLENLVEDGFYCSSNGRYLSWKDSEQEVMHVTDLETDNTFDVAAGDGLVIQPLGYIGTDCIYGTIPETDVLDSGIEAGYVPVSTLYILDATAGQLNVLKTYDGNGTYVKKVTVSNGNITLDRVVKSGNLYLETDSDTIRNRDMQDRGAVYVTTRFAEPKQTEILLQLSSDVPEKDPTMMIPDEVVSEGNNVIDISDDMTFSSYYVYAKGQVILGTNHVVEAILAADENKGVVIGESQTYIWKRGKNTSQSQIGIPGGVGSSAQDQAMSSLIIIAGGNVDEAQITGGTMTPYEIVSTAVTDHPVYNLSGCTLDQVLYFVSLGKPVYVAYDGGRLINGYDEDNVYIYNPLTKETDEVDLDTATDAFEDAGNSFIAIGK